MDHTSEMKSGKLICIGLLAHVAIESPMIRTTGKNVPAVIRPKLQPILQATGLPTPQQQPARRPVIAA